MKNEQLRGLTRPLEQEVEIEKKKKKMCDAMSIQKKLLLKLDDDED
jgi:hypothetical protein